MTPLPSYLLCWDLKNKTVDNNWQTDSHPSFHYHIRNMWRSLWPLISLYKIDLKRKCEFWQFWPKKGPNFLGFRPEIVQIWWPNFLKIPLAALPPNCSQLLFSCYKYLNINLWILHLHLKYYAFAIFQYNGWFKV